jgi:hypothetical protein
MPEESIQNNDNRLRIYLNQLLIRAGQNKVDRRLIKHLKADYSKEEGRKKINKDRRESVIDKSLAMNYMQKLEEV